LLAQADVLPTNTAGHVADLLPPEKCHQGELRLRVLFKRKARRPA
jgi:hypothetical protein